jgi:hypothetical protein
MPGWTSMATGAWDDAGEQVASNLLVAAGAQSLDLSIPAQAQPGARAARFRITSAGFPFVVGTAPDGEVEDHMLLLDGFDWGDAPPAYPVTAGQNGARHTPSALWLGAVPPDAEADGLPSAAAAGDDASGIDDEEGITLAAPPAAWRHGHRHRRRLGRRPAERVARFRWQRQLA